MTEATVPDTAPVPTPATMPTPASLPVPSASPTPSSVPTPAALRPPTVKQGSDPSQFGRVTEDGTVYLNAPEGEVADHQRSNSERDARPLKALRSLVESTTTSLSRSSW